MNEWSDELERALRELAGQMIQRYARGLLSEARLVEQLMEAWRQAPCEAKPEGRTLTWLAQGLCSQALCEACRSSEVDLRDQAFENLRCYLEEMLARALKSAWWADDLRAEALQQALVEIFNALRKPGGGPEQPAAFLKWGRVILFRQLARCLQQSRRSDWLSLEAQDEPALSALLDEGEANPLDAVLRAELQEALKRAIATLKNPQYRAVLFETFLSGLEESELAARWQVRVQDIYLWRYRALQALRKQPEVVQALRQLA